MTAAPRKQSKTYKVPKRPYEAARLDAELKVGSASYFNVWKRQDRGTNEDKANNMLFDV